jgi:hypothetical protein
VLIPGEGQREDEDLRVSTLGISCDLNDKIRLKSQFARVREHDEIQLVSQDAIAKIQDKFNVWAIAVSVFF